MELENRTKLLLMTQWGEKANSLSCDILVKYIDPLGDWACYIYALDPTDQDTIRCIVVDHDDFEVIYWSLEELYKTYNREGDFPIIDEEFRPWNAQKFLKRLEMRR